MSALRSLLKQPRFTLVAALTLALGAGAVVSIFSVVNGILLKPLPYPAADRLVNVWSHAPKLGYPQFPLSPDIFFAYERDNQIFESMALFQRRRANLVGASTPEIVETIATTHTYFETLGAPLSRGRAYSLAEEGPDGPRLAVVSHRAWRDRYAGAATVIGQVVRLDNQPHEIIGVASPMLDAPNSPDFFLPLRINRKTPTQGQFGWNAIARLKPGVDAAAASSHLAPLITRLMDAGISPTYRAFIVDGGYEPKVRLMKEDLVGELERPLWILLGTVGMLLLIACANVANLFLVRAEGRQREIAVRVALGATRASLVRQLMAEALTLSVIGAALGLVVAGAGLPALLRLAPPSIPRLDQVSLDPTVILFTVAIAIGSALLFGLLPALRYTRPAAISALKHGGRGGTDEPARRRARNALVVLQTAMALVLLVASGLLARSFSKLVATDLGFDARDIMTFRVALPPADYSNEEATRTFVLNLVARLREIPGVESAGAATVLPIANSAPGSAHELEGRPVAAGQLPPMVHYKVVGPGYFETMRIQQARGRDFHSGDFTSDNRNIIVNQALADLYWPGQDAVGKRIRLSPGGAATPPPWFTVIGVVGNERQDGLRLPVRPLIYYTPNDGSVNAQSRVFDYIARGPDITERGDALRAAVWSLDRNLPLAAVRSLQEIVDRSIVEFTFTMITLGIAAGMALLLGGIGLYGVLSYAVTLRTREIGVRLALGAPPARVMRSVVANGAAIASIGIAIGLGAAAGLTRFLGTLLFETPALDAPTFAAMAAALLAVAVVASFLPARRAAGVSPMESMKE
jgi:predicted permease